MAAPAYVPPPPPPLVAAARGAASAAATRHPPRRGGAAAAAGASAAAAPATAAAAAVVVAAVAAEGVVPPAVAAAAAAPPAAAAAAAATPAPAAAAVPFSYGAKVLPAALSPAPPGVVSLPYPAFLDALGRGEVVRVDFYDGGNVALAVLAGGPAGGPPVRLGEGYPIDVDDGWASPLWCMRVLADRGVPYTLHWRR